MGALKKAANLCLIFKVRTWGLRLLPELWGKKWDREGQGFWVPSWSLRRVCRHRLACRTEPWDRPPEACQTGRWTAFLRGLHLPPSHRLCSSARTAPPFRRGHQYLSWYRRRYVTYCLSSLNVSVGVSFLGTKQPFDDATPFLFFFFFF